MSAALDAAELLFNCLANVDGGNWQRQSPSWQDAALMARNAYHAALDADQRGLPGHPSDLRILNVLRSDYQLVLRLAADRLRTLDAAYPSEAKQAFYAAAGEPLPDPPKTPEWAAREVDTLTQQLEATTAALMRSEQARVEAERDRAVVRSDYQLEHERVGRLERALQASEQARIELENQTAGQQVAADRAAAAAHRLALQSWQTRAEAAERDRAALTLTVENYREQAADADRIVFLNSQTILQLQHKVDVLSERLTWVRGDAPGTVQPTEGPVPMPTTQVPTFRNPGLSQVPCADCPSRGLTDPDGTLPRGFKV